MLELHELKSGVRLQGLIAAGEVTVVAVEPHGDGVVRANLLIANDVALGKVSELVRA